MIKHKIVPISLELELFKIIEEKKGDVSRSRFIRNLIRDGLNKKGEK